MKPPSRWWLVLLFLGGLITAWLVLPVSNWLLALVDWVRAAGATGFITYAALYALATVLLLPGSVLTLGAGFVYGPIWGVLLASPASVIGATLAFLLGRFVARDWIRRRIATNPRFEAVDAAVGKGGFKIVLLLRLSPIFPFTLLNYALGLTRVRLRDYVLASFIGMLPGTVLYVYVGSLVTTAAQLFSGERPSTGPAAQVLFWVGLLATIVVVVAVTRIARRALDRELGKEPATETPLEVKTVS